jgi:putative ABC transport system ATP-binding protein
MSNVEDDAPALLRADGLSKTYADGQVQAVVAVSLEVRRGEYLAIMGPSGCGKSTLLNLLGGLDTPDQGAVFFEEESLATMRNLDAFRSTKIGYIFQSFLLIPTLRAIENVQVPMFGGPLSAARRTAKARGLLAEVGLSHRLYHLPSHLSVGERQRVAIARALANDPPLLLCDEPTGNLDSKTSGEVLDLFDRLRADRHVTLIVVTHSDTLARRATRVAKMLDGRLQDDFRQSGGWSSTRNDGGRADQFVSPTTASVPSQRPDTSIDFKSV